MMNALESYMPFAILALAVLLLLASCLTWRAGGKHLVMSSWILVAAGLAMVFEDGSRKQLAALIAGAVLIVMALMTTPGARVKTMRLEHALMALALAAIWATARLGTSSSLAAPILVAVVMIAAMAAIILRGVKEWRPKE